MVTAAFRCYTYFNIVVLVNGVDTVDVRVIFVGEATTCMRLEGTFSYSVFILYQEVEVGGRGTR